MSSDKFLRGAMILTLAGLMVKVIGSVNRILLSRLLGGEGIGLYQMAYPIYLLLLAVCAAGIPIAISIIVSGYLAQCDYGSVRQVFRLSLRLMAGVGLVLAALLALAAGWLVESGVIRDSRAYYALLALTPAIFFGSVLASFRGYFQGRQLMTPTAVSQIAEQFIRVMTMVVLAYALLPYGLEWAAAGAAFGAVPGSLTGLVVLGCCYHYYRRRWRAEEELPPLQPVPNSQLIRRILLLALPVSCANVLVPVTCSLDVMLVPRYLSDSGFSVQQATTLFGYLAGMAQPLLLMATIPTMSLATSLVPAVAEANALRQREAVAEKAATALKLCCLLTVPASVGLAVLAEPVSLLLYGTSQAATAICHTAPAILLLGLQQVTTGLLQGVGHSGLPMLHMLLGLLAKLLAVGTLTTNYQIAGAAWATNINFGITALLNLLALAYLRLQPLRPRLLLVLLAAALMGGVAYAVHSCLLPWGASLATIVAMLTAAACYAALLLTLGVVSWQELKQRFLKKHKKH